MNEQMKWYIEQALNEFVQLENEHKEQVLRYLEDNDDDWFLPTAVVMKALEFAVKDVG